jgi:hypothetical protein
MTGWFYFVTKPMFKLIDFFFHLVGNFGLAILIVTVIVKTVFFPLANKSYASMAKMKGGLRRFAPNPPYALRLLGIGSPMTRRR